MATDHWGCPVTAAPDEVALLERTAIDYVTMTPAIGAHLAPLAESGPLGRAVLAQLLAQSHRPHLMARARELSEIARQESGGLTNRERHHIDAAWAWSRGDIGATVDAFDGALAEHPTDLLALRSRYLLHFSMGRIEPMLAGVQTLAPAWTPDLPMASYLDGMEAFALEEAGRYGEAERLGRQGVDRDPDDLWAIHAVSHVFEMEGRRDEGVAWIDQTLGSSTETGPTPDGTTPDGPTPDGPTPAGFAGHLWWHQSLALLALGRHGDALTTFDRGIYPATSEEGLDLTNAISLLARLEVLGVDVGRRWVQLVKPATVRLGQHSQPFNDTHFVLALSRAGRSDLSRELIEGMRAWSTRRDDHAAGVLRAVGLAVAEALDAYGQGFTGFAANRLTPVVDQLWRLGGSRAQRQLYQLVLEASLTDARSQSPV